MLFEDGIGNHVAENASESERKDLLSELETNQTSWDALPCLIYSKMFIVSYGYRETKLDLKVQIFFVFLGRLVFQLKMSFLLIYTVYRNGQIQRPGLLFTIGSQEEGAYLKQGGNQGQGAYSF